MRGSQMDLVHWRDQCWGNFPVLRELLNSGEQGNTARENVP